MRIFLIYIAAFICSSCLNSFIKARIYDNISFTSELIDPYSIVVRIMISLTITLVILKILDNRSKT
jgi:hypothetical protein